MRFKKSTVVGVVMTLYLSTGSWCMYLAEKKIQTPKRNNETSTRSSDQIQICGNELTNLIIEACDGIVGSFSQANGSKGSAQAKITEDCCDHECPWDYLQTYCGQTPIFPTKKVVRGKLLSKLSNQILPTKRNGSSSVPARNVEKKPPSELPNNINRSWPPIQVGTISPEIDKFGGQPTVVVKKNHLNPV